MSKAGDRESENPFTVDRSCRGGCGRTQLAWLVTTGLPDPHQCYEHLSAVERAAYDDAYDAQAARFARLTNEPACWAWEIPEGREYATEEDADAALNDWQRGRGCAICGDTWDLITDHDHQTGLVRGQLCQTCNTREGKGYDTPPFVKYRERNPASMFGVQVRYWSPWTGYAEPEPVRTETEQAAEWTALRDAADRLTLPIPRPPRGPEPLPRSDRMDP